MGKNIGTRGSYMPFEAYEMSNLQKDVPFEGFGILGDFLSKIL